jgi:hypothetical protein
MEIEETISGQLSSLCQDTSACAITEEFSVGHGIILHEIITHFLFFSLTVWRVVSKLIEHNGKNLLCQKTWAL